MLWAETKEEALAILRKALPIEVEVIRTGEHKQIEYLNVYFNDRTEDRAVSVKDIDEGDTQDVKEGEPY